MYNTLLGYTSASRPVLPAAAAETCASVSFRIFRPR